MQVMVAFTASDRPDAAVEQAFPRPVERSLLSWLHSRRGFRWLAWKRPARSVVLDHGGEGHRVELESVVTSERLCIARGLVGRPG